MTIQIQTYIYLTHTQTNRMVAKKIVEDCIKLPDKRIKENFATMWISQRIFLLYNKNQHELHTREYIKFSYIVCCMVAARDKSYSTFLSFFISLSRLSLSLSLGWWKSLQRISFNSLFSTKNQAIWTRNLILNVLPQIYSSFF